MSTASAMLIQPRKEPRTQNLSSSCTDANAAPKHLTSSAVVIRVDGDEIFRQDISAAADRFHEIHTDLSSLRGRDVVVGVAYHPAEGSSGSSYWRRLELSSGLAAWWKDRMMLASMLTTLSLTAATLS